MRNVPYEVEGGAGRRRRKAKEEKITLTGVGETYPVLQGLVAKRR